MSIQSWVVGAIAAAAVVGVAVAGIAWYGHHQYSAGYAQAQVEAQAAAEKLSEQYRAQEQAAQQTAEANYAKYREQVATTEKHAADLDAAAGRLRGQLARLQAGRAATKPQPGARADGTTSPDVIGALAACAGRYDEVVRYAGRLADQVTGLQGYVAAVQAIEK